MGRPNHRIVASSLTGKRMAAAKGTADRLGADLSTVSADIRELNESVEKARAWDLARRKERRVPRGKKGGG